MDTNYLLRREQVSLMMAERAIGLEARFVHSGLAREYGRMLVARGFPHRQPPLAAALLDPSENPDLARAEGERVS